MITRNPRDYNFLNTSGCTKIDGMDDAAEFGDVVTAMNTLSFDQQFQLEPMKVVASVLHLGNAAFTAKMENNMEVAVMGDESQMAVRKVTFLPS
jgi:myosin heavy subunit